MTKCDWQPNNIGGVICSVCGHATLAPYDRDCEGKQVEKLKAKLAQNRAPKPCGGCGQPPSQNN